MKTAKSLEFEMPHGVSSEEFIKLWQSSKDIHEIMKRLMLIDNSVERKKVYQTAKYYRGHGVSLKEIKPALIGKDWAALSKLTGGK